MKFNFLLVFVITSNNLFAQVKYNSEKVHDFVRFYALKNNLTDSFLQDSNMFWSLNKKIESKKYSPLRSNICLIHLKTKDSGDYWIALYLPTDKFKNDTKNYRYSDIGGQYSIKVYEQLKVINYINRGRFKLSKLGVKSNFLHQKTNVISAIKNKNRTMVYIL